MQSSDYALAGLMSQSQAELMPDRSKLRPGDRIRLLSVPAGDLFQRERELVDGLDDAGWTADTLARVLARNPEVTIDRIDEYGQPWFDCEAQEADGTLMVHTFAVVEDDSWEHL
jgi:hypothetical protein